MIDIENKVITLIDAAFTAAGKTVKVSAAYNPEPSQFPYCYIEQSGNSTYQNSRDESLKEHHARVAFSIVIYSNLAGGSKSEAKALAQIADDTMQNIKFTRTDYDFFQDDRNISRIVMRYSAIVMEGVAVGNDTVYQIYR